MSALSGHEVRFAGLVAAVRKFRGMSQQQLADQVGIPRSAVSDIESYKRRVSVGEAVAIGGALGVSVLDLLSEVLTLTSEMELKLKVTVRVPHRPAGG